MRRAIQAATRHGVRYLTLYAFSTENWGRPSAEVDALMELFCQSVVNETPELIRQGVEVRMSRPNSNTGPSENATSPCWRGG